MTTNVQNTGTQIRFRDSTDFSPTAANNLTVGTPTDVQIDCTSLGAGSGRASAKVDFGATRPSLYAVRVCFEHAATPTAGDTVELYIAPSSSGTAATGNPGSVTGSDAAYTTTAADRLAQLVYIGTATLQAQTVNICEVGFYMPRERYGTLVIDNSASVAFHTDMAEFHVVFDPVVYGDA